jgi:NADH-quinone oxidoreductase subunit N
MRVHAPCRGLGRPCRWRPGAVYFYLIAYLIASFAVFGVMTVLAGPDDSDQELGTTRPGQGGPFLAGVLACGLGSLAGIPPFAGFMGKLFVFTARSGPGITASSRWRSAGS